MKILIVSSFLPYPLFSGGNVRLYNLMKYLNKNNQITLICEKRSYQTLSDIKQVEQVCDKVITVDRKKQWSIANIIKALFSVHPFLIVGHMNKNLKKVIKEELEREIYDLIHVETSYIYQNLPRVNIPVVLAEHNVEYLIYKRYLGKVNPILRNFLYPDVIKLKIEELSVWKKVDCLIAVSEKDKDEMGRRDVIVIPNGADTEKFRPKKIDTEREPKRLLFIGDFVYIQNQDAAEWLLKDFWPELKKVSKNLPIELRIVGKRIPKRIKNLKRTNIVFDENAPSNTESIFSNAELMLAPIRVGGGTSLKIIEAMAVGTPVITTSIGNEGIRGKDGTNIIIANTPYEFALKTVEILSDSKKYEELSRNARTFIEEKYDWKKIAKKLEGVYKDLIKKENE